MKIIVGSSEWVTLLERIKNNDPALTELDLSWNNLGDQGAEEIATALKTNTSLSDLRLYKSNIGAQGVEAIAIVLKSNTSLLVLDFGNNDLGDQGVEAIAAALKTNATLKKLFLDNNYIEDQGAEAVAAALKINTSLLELNLYINFIGDKGAEAIAAALQTNTSLSKLELGTNFFIGDNMQRNINFFIRRNNNLQNLQNLQQIKKTVISCFQFLKGWQENGHIIGMLPKDIVHYIFSYVFPFPYQRRGNKKLVADSFAKNIINFKFFKPTSNEIKSHQHEKNKDIQSMSKKLTKCKIM